MRPKTNFIVLIGIAILLFGVLVFFMQKRSAENVKIESTNTPSAAPSFSDTVQTVPASNPVSTAPESTSQSNISYQIISAEQNTYGYEISVGGKPIIRQTNIPGVAGNVGFASAATARKVAALVVQKMENHIMPPTVSPQELEQLNALK